MDPARLILVGPGAGRPCGIADYTRDLRQALAEILPVACMSYVEALELPPGAGPPLLMMYERSLVPGPDYLRRLARRFPGRVHLVPHEVHARDPFAFPYADLRAAFPPALWAKRLAYRWRHRDFARERRLMARGYLAHKVIPLSPPNADILAGAGAANLSAPVPLAFTPAPAVPAAPAPLPLSPISLVVGVFGFLNPATDYGLLLEALSRAGEGIALLLVGGERLPGGQVGEGVRALAARLGLASRVAITGHVPERRLDGYLAACGAFACPFRAKSNSASLLRLIDPGKPVAAADLPLTAWLRREGAPLDLFADAAGLSDWLRRIRAGGMAPRENQYPWSFQAVARAYAERMGWGGER